MSGPADHNPPIYGFLISHRIKGTVPTMDDRQRKVESGAGLQESRLNEDFIDLVKKHGTKVLLVLLVIMLTYVGWQRYKQWQEDLTDQAFSDLDNAARTPNVLLSVASQWDGRGSVWEIATLRAARAYLDSARTRTEPGVDPSTIPASDLLDDDRVRSMLNEANTLFESVLNRTRNNKPIFAQDARWGIATANLGLAAIAPGNERVRYLDAAEASLKELVELAEGTETNRYTAGLHRLDLIASLREGPIRIFETAALAPDSRFEADPVNQPAGMFQDDAPAPATGQGLDLNPLTPEEQEMVRRALMGDAANEGDDPETADPETTDPGSEDPGTGDPQQPGR